MNAAQTPATTPAATLQMADGRGLWARLREMLANQIRLWDRTLDDLRPWEQEGPLRWRGGRLEGAMLDADEVSAQVDRDAHQ